MINMVQCDEVVKVDVEKQQVSVLAGARVSQVLPFLRSCTQSVCLFVGLSVR